MHSLRNLALALLLVAGWTAVVVAARAPQSSGSTPPTHALPSALPNGVIEILSATPFAVDVPFVHEWRAEKPLVSAGYLLELQVDPDLGRTRETFEPVLYVGDQTAERCSYHATDGHVVVLVPAPLAPNGRVALDLEHTPIWFGSFELPERIDAGRIAQELALARAAGIGPARRSPSFRTRTSAADVVHVRTRAELAPYVEDLGGDELR